MDSGSSSSANGRDVAAMQQPQPHYQHAQYPSYQHQQYSQDQHQYYQYHPHSNLHYDPHQEQQYYMGPPLPPQQTQLKADNKSCAMCHATDRTLLACDDFDSQGEKRKRSMFCSECMIGKKVRVFWPLDSKWYLGVVQQFDAKTGEHLLKYEDDDTEWVKIGESNTTSDDHHIHAAPSPTVVSATSSAPANPVSPMTPGAGTGRQQHHDHKSEASGMPPHPLQHPAVSPDHKWSGNNAPRAQRDQVPPPSAPLPSMYPPTSSYHGYPPQGPPPPPPHEVTSTSYPQDIHPSMYGAPPQDYYMHGMPPPPPYHPQSHQPYPPHSSHSSHSHHLADRMNQVPSPTSSFSSTVTNSNTSNGKRKTGPKAWTKEEDARLLEVVLNMNMPMKWSVVAKALKNRTGKQCRERYVNHLNPRLKSTDWTCLEDATIFHLFDTMGSHWAKMSKMIPGRTDNGIKNRFHNLRRQLEREDEHRARQRQNANGEDFGEEVRMDRVRKIPSDMLTAKSCDLWNVQLGLASLAAQTSGTALTRNAGQFGPYREAGPGEMCVRCGFLMPSLHTGAEVCTKTGWCQTCTRVPSHANGNVLREVLNLRRAQDPQMRNIIESWDDKN